MIFSTMINGENLDLIFSSKMDTINILNESKDQKIEFELKDGGQSHCVYMISLE